MANEIVIHGNDNRKKVPGFLGDEFVKREEPPKLHVNMGLGGEMEAKVFTPECFKNPRQPQAPPSENPEGEGATITKLPPLKDRK